MNLRAITVTQNALNPHWSLNLTFYKKKKNWKNPSAHLHLLDLWIRYKLWMQTNTHIASVYLFLSLKTASQGGLRHFGVKATSWSSVNEWCVCTGHVRRSATPKTLRLQPHQRKHKLPTTSENRKAVGSMQSHFCCGREDVARCVWIWMKAVINESDSEVLSESLEVVSLTFKLWCLKSSFIWKADG